MYSCEKLARGTSGGIIKCGKAESAKNMSLHSNVKQDKRSYFGHANMFSVAEEKDLNRPVGKLYMSKT